MVWLVLLLDLFLICREPRCGDYVDRANIKTSFKGAALTITSTCNSNHTTQVQATTLGVLVQSSSTGTGTF